MTEYTVHSDIGVLAPSGLLEHGVVHDVSVRVVWVSLDSVVVDVPFDPQDSRLQPWPEVAA